MNLTPKQEAFCQAVVSGMTQSDAYRSAYDVSPETKAEGIHVDACKLAANPNVALRINELRDILAMANMWSRQDSVNVLKEIVQDGESRAGEKTSAVKELNAMYGFNAPVKAQVDANVAGGLSITVNLVKPDDGT
jgi:phage terminase small subunit